MQVLGFVNNSIRQATEKFFRPDDPDLNASNESFSDMKFQSTGEMSFTNSSSAVSFFKLSLLEFWTFSIFI